jgi:bifunctional polynucleotide phosphatase/kinase
MIDFFQNRKKDHSSADRNFAANLGIVFHTPEEFFLGYKVQPFIPMTFQPMQIDTDRPLFDPRLSNFYSYPEI